MRTRIAWLTARVLLLLALAHAASAQEVRGTVRDSATSQPVLGAVVMLLDAGDAMLGRSLTNQRGEYRIPLTITGARLRVVRLGFRPRVSPLPAPSAGVAQVDVTIAAIPVTLESVRTVAAPSCSRRSDASAALALLEQARGGLLTTIVSRGVEPARMKRLFFDRRMNGNSDRITHQHVRVDSVVTTGSFGATRSASEFVKQGFMLDSAGIRMFLAPDAETLLDDGFASGYCFRIMDAERSRPHQIGLGLRAADSRRERVDIEGALWIDTLARALVDLEFHYVGMDHMYEPYHPGGRVSFHAMPNGVVLVDRWSLRVVDVREDNATSLLGQRSAVVKCPTRSCPNLSRPVQYDTREVGGELANAAWDDGSSWKGALGRVVVHASQMGAVLKLEDTDYQAVSDANGDLAFEDLLPGPYALAVVDPTLSPLGITLTTGTSLTAARDSTLSVRVAVPSAADYVARLCDADQGAPGTAWILGRVVTPDGRPVGGAKWAVQRYADGAGAGDVVQSGLTGADGTFHYCRLALGARVRVAAQYPGAAETNLVQQLAERITVFRLELKPE